MNAFSNLLGKFSGGAAVPVIRMKGSRRSGRYLTLYFPASEECVVRSIPFSNLTEVWFSTAKRQATEEWEIYLNGNTFVAEVGSEEEAKEVLRRIACEIAPSKWVWPRRIFVLWLLYMLFMPAPRPHSARVPSALEQVQMMPVPQNAPGIPVGMNAPTAPPAILQSSQAVGPAAVAPAAPAAAPAPSGDPFGLQVAPEAK